MVDKEKIEQFIIGSHQFSKYEYTVKYRFLLVSSILIIGFTVSFFTTITQIAS